MVNVTVKQFQFNERIGYNTKAAARQSPNCIKKQKKKKYGKKRFSL